MATQSLVFAKDPAGVAAGAEAAGGRLLHAITTNLLVIELPDGVSAESIPGTSPADPGGLDGTERALAEAWLSRPPSQRASSRSLLLRFLHTTRLNE